MREMVDNQPIVSIVVAAYNAEAGIRKTIDSILSQSFRGYEIVVVDGMSTDKTWNIIQEYSDRISHKRSEKDRGIADAYNKGISASRGKWIYFLNADDVFSDNDVLAKVFASCGGYGDEEILVGTVVATDGRLFDGRFGWRLLIRNQVHHQAIFYPSSLLKSLPYNANYRNYGHDHEHNILIWRRKYAVRYLPIVIALWARGGISDKANWKQYREEFKVRRNAVGLYGYPFNIFSVMRFVGKRIRQNWLR